ncbi:hypothetical protein [Levilactobacillus wangkuiensis]|uniref:hypothetical protein n=1 Tax=Levilactobacillus wangkuiensis TaxID=2799566 RepID=UPI00194346E4|nr:hypothetical protein [Levilactobacillus wangkuiensis]
MRTKQQVTEAVANILKLYHAGDTDNLVLPLSMIKSIDGGKLAIRDLPLWAVDKLVSYRDGVNVGKIISIIRNPDKHTDIGLEIVLRTAMEHVTALQMIITGDMGYLPTGKAKSERTKMTYNGMEESVPLMIETARIVVKMIY